MSAASGDGNGNGRVAPWRRCPTCGFSPLYAVKETARLLVLGCPRCGARTFDFAKA